ncbi:putative helicase [Mobilicoccus pelagius NBRC 104925]|uniref:Putative helicase n=1 Tax=Mobilicoccus pelagius NBRC 104925 TaxID=1089455 RepID=H5UTY9_9MICO|nr:putative helicase [Mobilicoccus pelagius NBRC 104925]
MGELEGIAPGSLVVVRDEEWVVTQVAQTRDGVLVTAQGLGELVAGSTAQFYSELDDIRPFDPRGTRVVADASANHRRARLWLEATLRKTSLPIDDDRLAVTGSMLADALDYQRAAVRKALDPETLRPRILLADAVGLGKTLEIGMSLSELVRRGRGERILVVTPRHVLEQMQHELWCRFALPFVRLDSVGIQRVRRRLPATRNPFGLYKRAIISIDTLKNDRYLAHLRKHRWDAVVIDESHNITNSATQNNRLANVLAPQTDALILASATPHNGKRESFAELVRLLEPTAVTPEGDIDAGELDRLVIRRHRHSPDVATAVGGDWAERQPPHNRLVSASPEEDAIAQELADHWLYAARPTTRPATPGSGRSADALFGWTLQGVPLVPGGARGIGAQPSRPGERHVRRRSRVARAARRPGRGVHHRQVRGAARGVPPHRHRQVVAGAGRRLRRAGRDPALAPRPPHARPRHEAEPGAEPGRIATHSGSGLSSSTLCRLGPENESRFFNSPQPF